MAPTFREVRGAYATAEKTIKLAEQVLEVLPVVSVNELRYAGFHVLKAIDNENEESSKEHLIFAKDHCERATLDAAALALVALTERARGFLSEYRDVVISAVVTDIDDIRYRAEKAEATVSDVANSVDRLDIRSILKLISDIKEDVSKLTRHAPDLEKAQRAAIKARRRFVMATTIPIVTWAIYLIISEFL